MMNALAYRYKNALSWRIATDLCRRDPSLFITFPEGGSSVQANALMVGTERGLVYEMRRLGGGVVAHAQGLQVIDWDDVLNFETPRAVVVELERKGGIRRENTPPTNPKVIGYRLISAVLDAVLMDPRTWDWRPSSSGSLEKGVGTKVSDVTDWTPDMTRWHLVWNGERKVEVDSFGWIKAPRYAGPLLPIYKAHGRKIGKVMSETLGDVLP